MQSIGIPLDEYAPIVASICQDESLSLERNHLNGSGDDLVCFFLPITMRCNGILLVFRLKLTWKFLHLLNINPNFIIFFP